LEPVPKMHRIKDFANTAFALHSIFLNSTLQRSVTCVSV
ncbi:MAG: hypothetical protein JWR25_1464, partial [Noviherbaspirillum sp.]|nr:hypothetical protein [Noviherbaspirillum sp.]